MLAFQKIQQQFYRHIKDPNQPAISELEDRRLKVYRELFFNNVLGFLSNGFPVLAEIYGSAKWETLAREFFINHHSRSPYFVDISKEFVEFLSNEYELKESDPDFLLELAHYEWLELAISIRKESKDIVHWEEGTEVSSVSLSELAEPVSYQFPVHQIKPGSDFQSSEHPTFLVVNRNSDDEVKFTEINAITAHMLTIIQQTQTISIDELMGILTKDLPNIPQEQVVEGARITLMELLKSQILVPGN